MPIPFTCPHCGHFSQVDDQFAGQIGPCVQCGQTVTIPAAPAGSRSSNRTVVLVVVLSVLAVLLLCACPGMLAGLLLPAVQNARETARGAVCTTNLRQITLAMEMYQLQHGTYPPAYVADDQGRPMHSWRVLLLPHLERQDLYSRYNFDEPWDGPNNRQLHDQMPDVFACPSDPQTTPRNTNYVVVSGPGAIFNGAQSQSPNAVLQGDGLMMTLLVVETTAEICWLEPRDLDFNAMPMLVNAPQGRGISSRHPRGANVSFADGRTTLLSNEISSQDLRGLITYNGGEVVVLFQGR